MDSVFKKAAENLKEKIDYMDRCYLGGRVEPAKKSFPGIVDDYFCECFGSSAAGLEIGIMKNPYAIVALGGYGRGEYWSLPDLDLLFLFSRDVPDGAAALIREIVYPLWDMGWNVNYTLQTAREMAVLARKGIRTLSSLFDARFVCGVSTVYSDLSEFMRNSFFLHRSRSIGLTLKRMRQKRVEALSSAEYLLEPDLLKSPGGLMDLRGMLWIARLRFNFQELEELKYSGLFSSEEFFRLEQAGEFLGAARRHLCHAGGKSLGRLYDDFQDKVAVGMGFPRKQGISPREGLLTELSKRMALVNEFYDDLVHEAGLSEEKTAAGVSTLYRWISIKRGRLAFSSSLKLVASPDLLIRIFEERCRLKIPLGREAKRLVKEFAFLMEPRPEKISELLSLQKTSAPVLDEMLEAGLLQRIIPEFRGAEHLVRTDGITPSPLHRHLFRTVSAVNELEEEGEGLPGAVFTGLRFRKVLGWAALLHDIGRVRAPEDHVKGGIAVVERLFGSRGVDGCRTSLGELIFLMENQGFLKRLSKTRDIRDRDLIRAAGGRLKNPDRLKMLYILSVADGVATGGAAWDDALAENLKSLYLSVLGMMEGEAEEVGKPFPPGLPPQGAKVLERVAANVPAGYRGELSRRFLIDHVAFHLEIEQGVLKNERFHWEIQGGHIPGTRRVVVGAAGGKEVFSRVAGGLLLGGIEIIRAGIYPLGCGISVLIILTKEPVDRIFEEERWKIAEKQIGKAFRGEIDMEAAVSGKAFGGNRGRLPSITVDNSVGSLFSVVEITGEKRADLLFNGAIFLERSNLEVCFALTGSEAGKGFCVLYVREPEKGRLEPGKGRKAFETSLGKFLEASGSDSCDDRKQDARRHLPRAG